MATFTLTSGVDTFIGTEADDTVNGTAATLNATDSLDGGGGHDVLTLFGPGTFDLSALTQFSNFEQVDINSFGTGNPFDLTLRDGVDLTVNVTVGNGTIHLADGAVTLNLSLAGGSYQNVYASTGTTVINNNSGGANILLSSGEATVNQHSGSFLDLNYIRVSSGKTTIDLTGSEQGRVLLSDVDIINYDNEFIGSSAGTNILAADGSGGELDLTRLHLDGLWYLIVGLNSSNVTVDVDQASLSHINLVSGPGGHLQTAESTLDLTHLSSSAAIASTNAAGTTFTAANLETGLHVIGGPGYDTLIATGFAFTSIQRNAIFAQGSVEVIQDTSGTYNVSAVSVLTPGPDVFIGTGADDTVNGAASTLSAADSLDGGGGHDVLALFGTGTFDLSALAQFSNFEQVDINSFGSGNPFDLTLRDGADLTVNVDVGRGTIHLADGIVTLNLAGGSQNVYASTGTTVINNNSQDTNIFLSSGDATVYQSQPSPNSNYIWVSSGKTTIDLTGSVEGRVRLSDVNIVNYDDEFIGSSTGQNILIADGSGGELDLTRLHLDGLWYLIVGLTSSNVTVDVDQASLSHINLISGPGGHLQTAAATLDLTHLFSGAAIASTNAAGTTFTVADFDTGLHVIGGPGYDTLIATGFAFTSTQRNAIFAQGSVETIQDTSGTYFAPPPSLIIGGPGDDVLIGTSGKDLIDGLGGADYMAGGAGNDVYYVDNAGDQVVENPNEGNDIVYATFDYTLGANVESVVLVEGAGNIDAAGNSQDNALIGNSGYNALDGKGGADYMVGGAGNDIYFVDSAGDQVVENPNEGNDIVYATFDYTLGANVESVVLVAGAGNINAAGNNQDNALVGNSGNNALDGKGGADYMVGGAGNDIYYVDSAGDQVVENPNAGNDIVYATVDYTLGTNVESVVLVEGAGNINAAGNNDVNALVGNSDNNALDGKGGDDYMVGGAGNDIYYVDSAGDEVVENANEGNDIVYATFDYTLGANVESVVLVEGAGNINAAGNSDVNALVGNSGDNILDGHAGQDYLVGNGGNDTFQFHAGEVSSDIVVDFDGAGTAVGDSLLFIGYGTAAQGATFTNIGGNQWQIHSGLDGHNDVITLQNGATVDPSDFLFA